MLLKVYYFTSPIIDIRLENTLIYAVTISGIEIYTHRLGHNYFNRSSELIKLKYLENPVCLVNMRPFFGIRTILISNKTICLLSHASNPMTMEKTDSMINWTLYHLELPGICSFYRIFEDLANNCQTEDKQFLSNYFFHLITEGHVILQIVNEFGFIEMEMGPENVIKLAKLNVEKLEEIEELVIRSNCILGDFYGS